jgi:hypothetical protein
MDSNKDNIYSNYEKIVPSEKLPSFLFHVLEMFKEVKWAKDPQEEVYRQIFESSTQRYNKKKFFVGIFDRFFLRLIKKNGNKKKILIYSFRYPAIISAAKKHYQVGMIIRTKRERLLALKKFMGYIGLNDLDQYVLAYLKDKDVKHLHILIKAAEEKLKAVNPDYIVLWNDFMPVERAIVLAARKLSIPTLQIQDAYYESFIRPMAGEVADYILLWGEFYKDLYVKYNARKPEDIYILGYPYSIKKDRIFERENRECTVCYLGSPWEKFDKELLSVKIDTVKKINEICTRLKMKFFYRPHPNDDRGMLQKKLPDIQFTCEGEKLENTFTRADIFISYLSTSLIEAAMRSKITLQLMNFPIGQTDNFEELGICNKSFKIIEELENYLFKIYNAPSLQEFKTEFNNNYIETRYDPGRRFLEIMKEIEKIKK